MVTVPIRFGKMVIGPIGFWKIKMEFEKYRVNSKNRMMTTWPQNFAYDATPDIAKIVSWL